MNQLGEVLQVFATVNETIWYPRGSDIFYMGFKGCGEPFFTSNLGRGEDF